MKSFCKEFYFEAYKPPNFYPNYNKIHDRAVFYRKKSAGTDGPHFFHWLSNDEKAKAEKFVWATIESIPNPPYDGPPPLPLIGATHLNRDFPQHFRTQDRLQLNRMATNGDLINGDIKLLGERHMDTSYYAIIWKGITISFIFE